MKQSSRKGKQKEELKKGKGSGKSDKNRGRGGGREKTKERPNCNNCQITSITVTRDANPPETAAFPAKKDKVSFPASEDVNSLVISVTPSKPHCPCIWSNVALEYVWNLAGPENIKRRHLLMPQLIDAANNNLQKNGDYVTLNNCSLTINLSKLNTDMRTGAITPPFRKGVPMTIRTKVKCDPRQIGKAKIIEINITDAN